MATTRPSSGARLSLRARALKALASREHSRLELARKLSPHAEGPEALVKLLDELEKQGLLSEARFIESLVRRRSPRFGQARIRQELAQHGLDAERVGQALAELSEDELGRAYALWCQRYGSWPAEISERARQTRFLLQRGFSAEVVNQVFKRARLEASTLPD